MVQNRVIRCKKILKNNYFRNISILSMYNIIPLWQSCVDLLSKVDTTAPGAPYGAIVRNVFGYKKYNNNLNIKYYFKGFYFTHKLNQNKRFQTMIVIRGRPFDSWGGGALVFL